MGFAAGKGGGHGQPWMMILDLVGSSVHEGIARGEAWGRYRRALGCSPPKESSFGGLVREIDEGGLPLYMNRGTRN